MWESITTVLQTHDGITNKNELMCYTHLKGGKYGFFIDMPVTYDVKDPKLETFVNETFPKTIRMHNADIVALDLLKLLGDCNNTENHINPIVQVVTQVITQTRSKFPKLKVITRSATRENWASGFPTRSDTNRPVQSQKEAREEVLEWLYYSCSENKDWSSPLFSHWQV